MNPILNQLTQSSTGMNPIQALAFVKNLVYGKNPQMVFDNMVRTNPQFAQFVESIKGKDVTQLAKEYGVDVNTLKSLFE